MSDNFDDAIDCNDLVDFSDIEYNNLGDDKQKEDDDDDSVGIQLKVDISNISDNDDLLKDYESNENQNSEFCAKEKKLESSIDYVKTLYANLNTTKKSSDETESIEHKIIVLKLEKLKEKFPNFVGTIDKNKSTTFLDIQYDNIRLNIMKELNDINGSAKHNNTKPEMNKSENIIFDKIINMNDLELNDMLNKFNININNILSDGYIPLFYKEVSNIIGSTACHKKGWTGPTGPMGPSKYITKGWTGATGSIGPSKYTTQGWTGAFGLSIYNNSYSLQQSIGSTGAQCSELCSTCKCQSHKTHCKEK